jgi:hypothetical protein
LLAGAASLASYWLNHRTVTNGRHVVGWLTLAVGCALLLFAAVLGVTTWLAALTPAPIAETAMPTIGQPAAPRADTTVANDSPVVAARAKPRDAKRSSSTHDSASRRSDLPRDTTPTQLPASKLQDAALPRSRATILAAAAGPWGATRCVFALRKDPANPTNWTLENECDAAVGIVLASCNDASRCVGGGWDYLRDGILLPAKAQRSISQEEQTYSGVHIRYVACLIENAAAIELLSIDPPRTSKWREAFEAAAQIDPCLIAMRNGSAAGARLGHPIDVLLGPATPSNAHEARERSGN